MIDELNGKMSARAIEERSVGKIRMDWLFFVVVAIFCFASVCSLSLYRFASACACMSIEHMYERERDRERNMRTCLCAALCIVCEETCPCGYRYKDIFTTIPLIVCMCYCASLNDTPFVVCV